MTQYDLYGGTPPHSNEDTSLEAAESMRDHISHLAETVLSYITLRGEYGATEWEVSSGLSMLHQTTSARIRELYLKGRVKWDGVTKRRTATGRRARVWTAI